MVGIVTTANDNPPRRPTAEHGRLASKTRPLCTDATAGLVGDVAGRGPGTKPPGPVRVNATI
jgi:hypothetical protein